MKKLLVKPRTDGGPQGVGVLCARVETLGRTADFIGRKRVTVDGDLVGYEPTGEAVEVPTAATTDPEFHTLWMHYREEVRQGSLVAADAETAAACGVPFARTARAEESA